MPAGKPFDFHRAGLHRGQGPGINERRQHIVLQFIFLLRGMLPETVYFRRPAQHTDCQIEDVAGQLKKTCRL